MSARFQLSGDIESGVSDRLAAFLSANSGNVTLFINSPGGDALEGAAMMAEVERHGAVSVHVQGIAASAATLPMVAAREVIMHPAAMVMTHEPSAWGGGTADELRDTAAALDKMTATYAEAYARHTGHPVARIAAWMKAETWLTADEAVELRFADRVERAQPPQMVAAYEYSKFRQPPEGLIRLAQKNGWVTGSPDPTSQENKNAA
ncbi:head maturation protease, ClpP-related [Rhodobacter sp. 24-YEA-8]|uniref:head maturation protease, ClpP-related n=1 Tax=Rhodobacter sp. 24-YEA-8 TaxID=1884310 RepID=UPI0008942C85|nr:head maturation protease, ClpP-related [Rhodobacter sp. 24-YEA-8]SEC27697.1 ATP-dependent protease ClpP, protease subunit [Rhodobacter sp. 24-YEA-8]